MMTNATRAVLRPVQVLALGTLTVMTNASPLCTLVRQHETARLVQRLGLFRCARIEAYADGTKGVNESSFVDTFLDGWSYPSDTMSPRRTRPIRRLPRHPFIYAAPYP